MYTALGIICIVTLMSSIICYALGLSIVGGFLLIISMATGLAIFTDSNDHEDLS